MEAYIPPVTLQLVAADPLVSLRQADALPAQFTFILCRLGKKCAVPKCRALEKLKTYPEARVTEHDDYTAREMLPVCVRLMLLMSLRNASGTSSSNLVFCFIG